MENSPTPTEQSGVVEPVKEPSGDTPESKPEVKSDTPPNPRESILALITKVDGIMLSPNQRAMKVWEQINFSSKEGSELNVWDLLCFCSEAMGYLAVTLMPEILDNVKAISNQVHSTHYFKSTDVFEWSQEPDNKLVAVDIKELVKKS